MTTRLPLFGSVALALVGALFVAFDQVGLGVALWILAALLSQAVLFADVWRSGSERMAAQPSLGPVRALVEGAAAAARRLRLRLAGR